MTLRRQPDDGRDFFARQALLATVIAWACLGCTTPGAPRTGARTAEVKSAPFEDVFLLSGEIEAVRSLDFAAPRSSGEARIQWLAADGSEVRAGEVLIAYDASAILGGLEDKRLRLTQARIELDSRGRTAEADQLAKQAAAERAEVEWEQARLKADVPVELQPRRDWQEKQNALRRAAAAREKTRGEARAAAAAGAAERTAARSAFDKAERDLEDAEKQLEALRVRAPRDGIFLVADHWNRSEARKLQAGDVAFMGQRVAALPDLSELQVAARLSAVDDGRIAAGQEARCVLDAYPDRPYPCRLAEIGAAAEEGPSPGFRVRLELRESDPARMRPGMSVRVEVVRRRLERALLVPRGALAREAGHVYARLAGGGRAQLSVLACEALTCAVTAGVREGQRVALP